MPHQPAAFFAQTCPSISHEPLCLQRLAHRLHDFALTLLRHYLLSRGHTDACYDVADSCLPRLTG